MRPVTTASDVRSPRGCSRMVATVEISSAPATKVGPVRIRGVIHKGR
jgi:hypothetical protein